MIGNATLDGVFPHRHGASAGRALAISPFRQALLLRGHGEWAFQADGKHVRVAREAPLQLSFVTLASSTATADVR